MVKRKGLDFMFIRKVPVLLLYAHFSGKQLGRKMRAGCTCFGINPQYYNNFVIILVMGHEDMLSL
jgi:hypothetical protein